MEVPHKKNEKKISYKTQNYKWKIHAPSLFCFHMKNSAPIFGLYVFIFWSFIKWFKWFIWKYSSPFRKTDFIWNHNWFHSCILVIHPIKFKIYIYATNIPSQINSFMVKTYFHMKKRIDDKQNLVKMTCEKVKQIYA